MTEVGQVVRIAQVRVSRRAADKLRAGHVWVYRTDLEPADASDPSLLPAPGALVRVVDARGHLLGAGTYSTSSAIAVRLLSRTEPLDRPAFLALVQDRVRQALALRPSLRRTETSAQQTDAQRLIFSEADGLPGVILDRYADVLVLQLLTQGMAQDDVRQSIAAALHDESVAGSGHITLWERPDPRMRELEELPEPAAAPLLHPAGAEPQGQTLFHLNGLAFAFDVHAGQKTGAFLDQRLNYHAVEHTVAALASGNGVTTRRALDVCTYQGGFALHLARVCDRVTGVDASRAALEVADSNLEQNRPHLRAEVDWIEADAFALLRAWDEAGERFGTVVLDPPAFARSKRAVEGALRGYKELNLRALRMLEPGGVLATCSCSHHVSEGMLRDVVAAAAADAGRGVQVLESRGAAPDHPEIATLPETRYLKCLICRVS